MSRQTNAFQRLVGEIQRLLAPLGVLVREPAELPDLDTGEPREIDVLIEGDFLGIRLAIGIEARGGGRKADVRWLEELRSKRESTGISQIIAVHAAGFSRPALKKGRKYGIPCLTLREAEDNDWRLAVCRFAMRYLEFKIEGVMLLSGDEIDSFYQTGRTPDRTVGEPADVTNWRPRIQEIEHDAMVFVARRAKHLLSENFARDFPTYLALPKRVGIPVPLTIESPDEDVEAFSGGFLVEFSVQRNEERAVVHSSYGDDMIVVTERDGEQTESPLLVAKYTPNGVEWVRHRGR